jgi:hypothetical protein
MDCILHYSIVSLQTFINNHYTVAWLDENMEGKDSSSEHVFSLLALV